jgi:lipoprotein-anchoring transpeptidase ErfK/SrfK
MFDYIDSSGNVITYDQINKMAKEGKTSFDAIVKKNGYKPKPKTTKVKSGAELLGIDTTAKKAITIGGNADGLAFAPKGFKHIELVSHLSEEERKLAPLNQIK